MIWKTKKFFLNLLFHFLNLYQILNILKKRMIVIANVFKKVETVKILIRPLSEKRRFRTRFDSQHVKASQILVKSPWEHFSHVFSSFSEKLNWKMSPLELGEILGGFVNTLTVGGNYPAQDFENLQLPIQMVLSEKWKTFSEFLVSLLKPTSNFKHFEKRMIFTANVFPKLQTMKILVRRLSK